MISALIHRYDNQPDILAVEARGHSDVYTASSRKDFTHVIVVPTLSANSEITVVAEAASEQYTPPPREAEGGEEWPGRPDRYLVRVDVTNVRYTTRERVKEAFWAAGYNWAGAWTVRVVELDEALLFSEEDDETLLEWLGPDYLSRPQPIDYPEEVTGEPTLYPEGAARTITVNAYERNPEARRRCLAHHGTACVVCGFDFGAAYGPEAQGYIHVHHLIPLASVGEAHEVDPIEELRPVCPNCHAVIHLGGKLRTIEEVRALLQQSG